MYLKVHVKKRFLLIPKSVSANRQVYIFVVYNVACRVRFVERLPIAAMLWCHWVIRIDNCAGLTSKAHRYTSNSFNLSGVKRFPPIGSRNSTLSTITAGNCRFRSVWRCVVVIFFFNQFLSLFVFHYQSKKKFCISWTVCMFQTKYMYMNCTMLISNHIFMNLKREQYF